MGDSPAPGGFIPVSSPALPVLFSGDILAAPFGSGGTSPQFSTFEFGFSCHECRIRSGSCSDCLTELHAPPAAMSILSGLRQLFRSKPLKPPYETADIYQSMRSLVLKLKPADIGETDASKILALVMDTGLEEAAFTLSAMADGTASLYLSNGGGIIGAGEHPEGAAAAKTLLVQATGFLAKLNPVRDTPLVMPGMTSIYLVTGKGVFSVTGRDVDFGEGRHPVSPLFHNAHRLIAVIRWIESRRPGQP